MRDKILKELNNIEIEHDVKILFAIESGSRAWGFESKDSDYDVRFVYAHKKDWYLSLDKKRDVIELPIDDLLDINGWDIRKALSLFFKSNPTLLECIESPIVYIDGTLREDLLREKEKFFREKSAIYHYLHMANNNYREYLRKDMVKVKKYFYVLRPLFVCKWIEDYSKPAPVEFDKLIEKMDLSKEFLKELDRLLEVKRRGREMDMEPRIDIINEYIEERIEYYNKFASTLPLPKENRITELDYLFSKYIVL